MCTSASASGARTGVFRSRASLRVQRFSSSTAFDNEWQLDRTVNPSSSSSSAPPPPQHTHTHLPWTTPGVGDALCCSADLPLLWALGSRCPLRAAIGSGRVCRLCRHGSPVSFSGAELSVSSAPPGETHHMSVYLSESPRALPHLQGKKTPGRPKQKLGLLRLSPACAMDGARVDGGGAGSGRRWGERRLRHERKSVTAVLAATLHHSCDVGEARGGLRGQKIASTWLRTGTHLFEGAPAREAVGAGSARRCSCAALGGPSSPFSSHWGSFVGHSTSCRAGVRCA